MRWDSWLLLTKDVVTMIKNKVEKGTDLLMQGCVVTGAMTMLSNITYTTIGDESSTLLLYLTIISSATFGLGMIAAIIGFALDILDID